MDSLWSLKSKKGAVNSVFIDIVERVPLAISVKIDLQK